MNLKRIIPKGVNLIQKSAARFKFSTSAESSSPRNEGLNLKDVWKHFVRVVTGKSWQDVANVVVIITGCTGALLVTSEFFSIGEIKEQISGMRQDMATQAVRFDAQSAKIDAQSARIEKLVDVQSARIDAQAARTDAQAARTEKLFEKWMEQTTDNQKQFAYLTGQLEIHSKEIADSSKKADERYYELLNALKK